MKSAGKKLRRCGGQDLGAAWGPGLWRQPAPQGLARPGAPAASPTPPGEERGSFRPTGWVTLTDEAECSRNNCEVSHGSSQVRKEAAPPRPAPISGSWPSPGLSARPWCRWELAWHSQM